MIVHINCAGTVSNEFKIGKAGPTILHGSDDPANGIGRAGDLYVKIDLQARMFVKQGNMWMASGDIAFGFVRDTIAMGETANISTAVTYFAVVNSENEAATALYLPAGFFGKRLIIKDETGKAGTYPITVYPSGNDLIDDAAFVVLDRNNGALNLVYDDGWFVTGSF